MCKLDSLMDESMALTSNGSLCWETTFRWLRVSVAVWDPRERLLKEDSIAGGVAVVRRAFDSVVMQKRKGKEIRA